MADGKTADDAQTKTTGSSDFLFGNGEWAQPFSGAPLKMYATLRKEALEAMARYLQIQIEYLEKLAKCDGPADALACQSEFVRKAATHSFEEGKHIADKLRDSMSAPAADK
ncbi:MAG: phasin family protein [Parvibaculaceae bacterium]|nr:phasin family protein [Parvibaculaceae bacterium]